MKKNIIIITLLVLLVSLGIYSRFLFIDAMNAKGEISFVRLEIKEQKHRADMLEKSSAQEAARAVMFEAKSLTLQEELDAVKVQLSGCK